MADRNTDLDHLNDRAVRFHYEVDGGAEMTTNRPAHSDARDASRLLSPSQSRAGGRER